MFRVMWYDDEGKLFNRDYESRQEANKVVNRLLRWGFDTAHWVELRSKTYG